MIGYSGLYASIGMGEYDDGFKKPGAPYNFLHFKTDGAHQLMAHMRPDVIFIENPETVDIVKIDQNVGAFGRGYLDAGYAKDIFIIIDFQGTLDGIMVGNGDTYV